MTFLDSDVSTESLKHPDPQTFWNEEEESMSETTITNVTTGGRVDDREKGPAPLIVPLRNFDPTLRHDSATLQLCSDRALSYQSLKVTADAFVEFSPFTESLPSNQPPMSSIPSQRTLKFTGQNVMCPRRSTS